jgi:large subunit ribosomal protein L29
MAKEKLVLADKNVEELSSELGSMESQLIQMKFDHAVRGLANPMEIRSMRRNIARINTELRSREVAALSPEQIEMRSKLRARRRRQK